jgi:uncharacterized surface protein with fasciclin (FAS1) repeats
MSMKSLYNKVITIGALAFISFSCEDDFKSPELAEGETIVAVASANADFDLLEASLIKTGLAATLNNNNSGQFTVFAPNDAAFLTYYQSASVFNDPALTEEGVIAKIQALTNVSTPLNIGQLTQRLNYHLISSEIKSASITGSITLTTLSTPSNTSGQARLSLSIVGTEVWINANTSSNGAKVLAVDADASNGVIHTIDRVLTAPTTASILQQVGYQTSTTVQPVNYATSPPTINGGNTPDAVDTDYDVFAIALRKTGVLFTVFPSTTPLADYTVFAPRDLPFRTYLATLSASVTSEATAQTFINGLNDTTTPTLAQFTDIIKYHIVSGRVLSSDLSDEQVVTNLLTGKTFTVDVTSGVITLKDLNTGATDPLVVAGNILTNAGIVHGIDGVMRPN